ncbi:MAG: hypothetical protein GC201_13600 [Alphaproteobacteria bacterium]|nr:hypothetical protein [Alphaproteobacteria bacterium]
MPLRRARRAALLAAAAGLLASCGPDYQEMVTRECVRDDQPRDYCECLAKGMRKALGPERYSLFTDFMLLGGHRKATPDDILRLMEKHKLTPEQLTDARNAMDDAMPVVDRQCR